MSVPSFSSFPDLLLESGPKSTQQKDGTDKQKRSRRHGKSARGDYHHNDERRNPDTESAGVHELASRIFYSDRKGDRYNIEYGGLHAGGVPRYSLVDRGRTILGLSYAWMAYYRRGKGVEVGLRGRRKMTSLTDSSSRALLAAPPTRRFSLSGDVYKHQEIDGFLRLPASRRSNSGQPYRSVTGPKGDIDSDTESSEASRNSFQDECSESESEESTLTSYQTTLRELEKRLKQEPTSMDDWLHLLSHTLFTIPVTSKSATTVRSEITLSILSRAFAADARNRNFQLLRVMYMKAGEEIWHESKVNAEWEDALKIGGMEVWFEWLEWRIRKSGQGVDGVVSDALRLLKVLGYGEEDELTKVRLFWRVAVVLKNAGFPERATAMFQAQAELTFEVPQAFYELPHNTQAAQLEEFWESEAPRLGEEGAEGWATWISSGRKQRNAGTPVVSTTSGITDLDPYRQWAAREIHSDQTQFLPCRSFDESSDPYSTTLFSDVHPLLINLRAHSGKNAFRKAWLSFFGLHIPGFGASLSRTNEVNWDDRWTASHLTKAPYLSALFPQESLQMRLKTDAIAGVIVGREKEYASGFGPVQSWGDGVLNPLDLRVWSEGLGKGTKIAVFWRPEDIEGLDVAFARRIFEQLRLGDDDVEWDVLSLAFEAAVNIKHSIKISRSFLSKSESLSRWAAHAQLEVSRGRLDNARKVYQAVLITSHTSKGTSLLWWNWAEMEWLAGNGEQAVDVILRAVGVEGAGGVAILRGRRGLDDVIKNEAPWKDREGWIKMRALLELLVNDGPSGAMAVYDGYLSGERPKSVRRESLLVGCLTMLYHYGVVLKNATPPAVLRQRVDEALEEYPSNSVILGMFLEGERGQGAWGRVRGMLGESSGKAKDVMRRMEEVWVASWERGRWVSEIERTRSGLGAAVESERTRGSFIIWRVYLELEIRAGELRRAKKLFFRAIGECPLVKELYLLAFGPLREVFSGEELRRIGDTMVERGLRLREGLEDGLIGWGDDGGETSDGGEEEIEANAKELRRLMPY